MAILIGFFYPSANLMYILNFNSKNDWLLCLIVKFI